MKTSFLKSPVFHCLLVASSATAILSHNYPIVGIDYSYFIPRLLDSHLYYLKNGIEIQWWTPFFGGGLPSYPNPQQMQFSLPQFLLFLMNPWMAIVVTMAIFTAIGYFATYYFFSNIAEVSSELSVLGATLFCVSSFFVNHLTAGQLGYHGFTLLPLILLILFQTKDSILTSSLCLGLILSYLIHTGGFYLVVIFSLSLPLSMLLVDVLVGSRRIDLRRKAKMIVGGGLVALMVGGSKMAAILKLMTCFPRIKDDSYQVSFIKGVAGLLMQLFFVPIANVVNTVALTLSGTQESVLWDTNELLQRFGGFPYGLWEKDVGMSPVILIIFFLFLFKFRSLFAAGKKYLLEKKYQLALTVLACWISMELSMAKGLLYPFIKSMPLYQSLHVNVRFASIFVFPLVLIAVVVGRALDKASKSGAMKFKNAAVPLSFLAVGFYLFYLSVPARYGFVRFNVEAAVDSWKEMNRSGENIGVQKIALIADRDVFLHRSSSVRPYEPLFGYWLEDFHSEVEIGRVTNVREGKYFNLTHPASLVFPETNGLRPFELISRWDRENFLRFVDHRPTTWILPRRQVLLDYVSKYSFLAIAIYLLLMMGLYMRGVLVRRRHSKLQI